MAKLRILIFTLPLLTACGTGAAVTGPSTAPSYKESNTGWMHGKCLAIKNPELPVNTKINLIRLDNPQTLGTGRITWKAASPENCSPLREERRHVNRGDGYTFYLVDTRLKINLAIGVLNEKIDPHKYTYNYCVTGEGIRFSLWDNHRVLWSGYYYLGYDTEPTCE